MSPTCKSGSFLNKVKKKYRWIKKNEWILLLWNEHRRLKQHINLKRFSDKEAVNNLFFDAFGKYPDLENPIGYNEKLQWLKLYYRDPLMVKCAGKYTVREYLKEKGHGHILNDLYGVYDSVENIDINILPDSFVLKATHGSNWNIICRDKKKINWVVWKLIMKSWLKQNIYVDGREWIYNYIKPRIICEKYLEDHSGQFFDYKFFLINGKVAFIKVTDNDLSRIKMNLYDTEWNLMDVKYGEYRNSPKTIPRPSNLDEMLKMSEDLSAPFPFARVDLYDINGKIIFGEFTFFPSSGFKKFEPEEFDLVLGEKLKLPEKNFNF